MEKNRIGDPYVKNALAFKTMAAKTSEPDEFLEMASVRPFMLTASGLSDKSVQYLTVDDQTAAIKEEIDRQHHTIPKQRTQRPKDKHCGNVHNRLFRHG